MGNKITPTLRQDAWLHLRKYTRARIALGSAGMSLPSSAHLEFQLAHAQARDAVDMSLDFNRLEQSLTNQGLQTIRLQSQAQHQRVYLQRPDKGRLLSEDASARIAALDLSTPPDIALVVADGLSSKAIEKHAAAMIELLLPRLQAKAYSLSPVCLVKHGRVAIGDPISELLAARMTAVLIGERPGLSSADSMGIYFTFQAKTGTMDAERNCISNIHCNGLSYQQAVDKLLFLIDEADRLKLSGVNLQDESSAAGSIIQQEARKNFLLQ